MKGPITILLNTRNLWRTFKYVEAILYAIGLAVFLYWLTNLPIALIIGGLTFLITLWLLKPWQISIIHASSLIDRHFDDAEYSTGLLLKSPEDLSLISQLQQQKVVQLLSKSKAAMPPHNLSRGLFFAIALGATGLLISYVLPINEVSGSADQIIKEQTETPISEAKKPLMPKLTSTQLQIKPPAYTGLKSSRSEDLNINAVEGSRVFWSLITNDVVDEVWLEVAGHESRPMKKQGRSFTANAKLQEDGFYNFKLTASHGAIKTTKLYQIKVVKDLAPEVSIKGIDQYTDFSFGESKKVSFRSEVKDDYGLTEAYIIATVSKGSGESVKFREEKLDFENQKIAGRKSVSLSKTIDLDQMDMTPGDELYFYVEAIDNRFPEKQKTRTETYFLTISDTTEIEFSLAGSLGVDLMPEYFRSQRQLIIDTEKLISERGEIKQKDFNFTSNELGYDQKALRLKYGQFMGVEDESGIAIETNDGAHEGGEESEGSEDDPLSEYSHDHDGDNEHNLVADDHEHEGEEGEDDPLDEFMHDHDDPEEATLYTQSTRSMLKQAMAEMWDAELYLRLYQPEKSLPYQYKALKLIKKIKNHARIYVHRIGFDPPPIKEESRLTGELDEVKPGSISENQKESQKYLALKSTVVRIEELLRNEQRALSEKDRMLFLEAANVLAPLAIEQPVLYLKSLEQLKQLSNSEVPDVGMTAILKQVSASLITAIPEETNDPTVSRMEIGELSNRYFKKLKQANE